MSSLLLRQVGRVARLGAWQSQKRVIQQRLFVSATSSVLDKQVVKVPGMGDSITEGTVVEWTAQVGQAVNVDDVVAMVETDKVTVEIKAEKSGVITKHFGSIDETVEVGADLYEIDPSATATVEAADSSSNTETTEEAPAKSSPVESPPAAEPTMTQTKESHQHRVPSIKFLGKEGWAKRLAGTSEPEMVYIPPNYGRPMFSEEEMEALILGGASLAPEVVEYSYGAQFKV